jgi:hypothetical protein
MRPAEQLAFRWLSRHTLWFTGVLTITVVRLQRHPIRSDSADQMKVNWETHPHG